jgi:hypothetical protein
MPKRSCRNCGAPIIDRRGNAKLCSHDCLKAERSRVEKGSRKSLWFDRDCRRCGTAFRDHPNARYCSPTCRGISMVEREKRRDRRTRSGGASC